MTLRSWATPLTVGAFLLISVTGIMLFFHLETGLSKFAHEWLGWALVFGVAAHLWLNWRAFTTYFKRPVAMAIMGAGVILLLASVLAPTGTGGGLPLRAVIGSLTKAQISTLARLSGKEERSLLAILAPDHPGVTAEQSLAELTANDTGAAVALLAKVYAEVPAE